MNMSRNFPFHPSMDDPIPIDALHSFHSKERQLFSRLVFRLRIESKTTMEIIAFWLWLEENGHSDVIRKISSLDDATLRTIASVAESFIKALHHKSPNSSTNSQQHDQSFHKAAITGINYYLNNVCLKAFDDLHRKAEFEAHLASIERLIPRMNLVNLNTDASANVNPMQRSSILKTLTNSNGYHVDPFAHDGERFMDNMTSFGIHRQPMPKPIGKKTYFHRGESSSVGVPRIPTRDDDSNKWIPPNLVDIESATTYGWPFNNDVVRSKFGVFQKPRESYEFTNQTLVNPNDRHFRLNIKNTSPEYHMMERELSANPPQLCLFPAEECNIPQDERTLFVTFSSGYPLSIEELHHFFMRNYGDVEHVQIQESDGDKPPLYGHVTFYNPSTLMTVLNGSPKVKFMTNGKHLWARRFVPKRKFKEAMNEFYE